MAAGHKFTWQDTGDDQIGTAHCTVGNQCTYGPGITTNSKAVIYPARVSDNTQYTVVTDSTLYGAYGTQPVAFSLWIYFKQPAAGQFPRIVLSISSDSSNEGVVFLYDPLGVYTAEPGSGDAVKWRLSNWIYNLKSSERNTASSMYDKWTHIVLLRKGDTNEQLWINGELDTAYTTTNNDANLTPSILTLGSWTISAAAAAVEGQKVGEYMVYNNYYPIPTEIKNKYAFDRGFF